MHEQQLSLAEILAALSRALDLTEGQPDGHSIRACLIGMRLAGAAAISSEQRACLYYALLLKDAGCSANSSPVARLFGTDDRPVKRGFKTTDWPRLLPATLYGVRNAGLGRSLLGRFMGVARLGMAGPDAGRELVRIRCERGADIMRRLGVPEETAGAVYSLDEHWNGGGHPDGLEGEEIPVLARIAGVAQTVDVFATWRGVDAAMDMLRERRGRWFEPRLVDEVLAWESDREWWDLLASPDAGLAVVEAEPDDHARPVDQEGLDAIAEAFAGIIDAKSPYTSEHSRGVARYAVAIGEQLGLDRAGLRDLRRGGLLHDIGKLGVSSRILDKPGPLTLRERAQVQRHPAYGWQIMKRVRAFEAFAWQAVLHHERLDGEGYPWGVDASELEPAARIFSVADVFEALTAKRPYREPMPATAALAVLERGRDTAFDAVIVEALDAAVLSRADGAVAGAA
jgi:HD-GYP domain-containing protein (c-di-GMP phosphodiesterase class II)